MFESIINFFKKIGKQEKETVKSKDAAKERLHLVLMQDRANVSADFLDLMKQEIIEVIKKYIDVDENAIDVRLTNKANGDGTNGAPALYANIPIVSIKEDVKRVAKPNEVEKEKEEEITQKIEKEQTEEQNTNNEQEQKVEENSVITSEQKPYENMNRENSTVTNEQKSYESVNSENSTVTSEQKPYENMNSANNIVINEQKPYENINRENYTAPNEPKTYGNWKNKIRQETQETTNASVPTEHKEETGNYMRTF